MRTEFLKRSNNCVEIKLDIISDLKPKDTCRGEQVELPCNIQVASFNLTVRLLSVKTQPWSVMIHR